MSERLPFSPSEEHREIRRDMSPPRISLHPDWEQQARGSIVSGTGPINRRRGGSLRQRGRRVKGGMPRCCSPPSGVPGTADHALHTLGDRGRSVLKGAAPAKRPKWSDVEGGGLSDRRGTRQGETPGTSGGAEPPARQGTPTDRREAVPPLPHRPTGPPLPAPAGI